MKKWIYFIFSLGAWAYLSLKKTKYQIAAYLVKKVDLNIYIFWHAVRTGFLKLQLIWLGIGTKPFENSKSRSYLSMGVIPKNEPILHIFETISQLTADLLGNLRRNLNPSPKTEPTSNIFCEESKYPRIARNVKIQLRCMFWNWNRNLPNSDNLGVALNNPLKKNSNCGFG